MQIVVVADAAPPVDGAVLVLWVVVAPLVPPPVDRDLCAPPAASDGGGTEPLTCPVEGIVCVGTASGSVPQEGDVVMPPVALCETEHGML